MVATPCEITLELRPERRVDVIDINARLREQADGFLSEFQRALYCSYHTTAGYLEQSICDRLHRRGTVEAFLEPFQELFPPEAPYRHDQMHLRTELSPEQRRTEPRNADSHLTFIGSGLENCVTYACDPQRPVYFVDLDGINQDNAGDVRTRRTTILGYDTEATVERVTLDVPVSAHPIDSVSLRDPRLGVFDQLHELLAERGIRHGRIDLHLAKGERHAGLTVNEYETLLMKHDLVEVLRDPLRFMARKGRNMLRDPGAIPVKAKNYAKYDLVRLVNRCLDTLGLSESVVERVIDKCLAVPAERFLRMKRSVSLLVSEDPRNGEGTIVQGRYQSPILVQWRKARPGARRIEATLTRFG
jgi:thiamine phosphate synthase YjbQ (UPF0047 family)